MQPTTAPREFDTDRLERAERHVALGQRHVTRQRELITELKAGGHDTKLSEQLLQVFEELQALHIADRDRLLTDASRT